MKAWGRAAVAYSMDGGFHDGLPSEPAMRLPPSAAIVLPADSEHQVVICDEGAVWITQGDGKDYVLTKGQRLALRPADKVIVRAMADPAVVRLPTGGQASDRLAPRSTTKRGQPTA